MYFSKILFYNYSFKYKSIIFRFLKLCILIIKIHNFCKFYISDRIYAFLFSTAPLVYQSRGCVWQMPRVVMMESPIYTQNRRKATNKLG